MTTQSLPTSTFIDISTSIAGGGAVRLPFGRGLLMTTDDTLSAGGSRKAELFSSLNAVVRRFGSSGDVADGAGVWFSADPQPQGLWIGRWANVDVDTTITSGSAPTVAANAGAFQATDASFTVGGQDVTGVNLSGHTTYAAIAGAIQTAIAALGGIFVGATFEYVASPSSFVLTLASSAAISPAYFGTASGGTDISTALVMAQANSPAYRQGSDVETAVEAVTAMVALATTGPPVAIMLAPDVPDTAGTPPVDTRVALGAWANAGDYMFGLRDTSAQALVANDATSHLALAFDSNQGQTMAFFDNAGALPEIGGLALLSAQNLNNPQSIISTHAKPVPGVLPSNISVTQWEELKRKRANVVTRVGGLQSLVGGSTSRVGYWADAVWWLLWLKNEAVLANWNALRGSRRLTAAILTDAMTGVLEAGVRSGGIAPGGQVDMPMEDMEDMEGTMPMAGGEVKADIIATTGNQEFNGTLTAGYLLWVERASERTLVDRQNRQGRWKAWIVPSPAIHEVTGDIVLTG